VKNEEGLMIASELTPELGRLTAVDKLTLIGQLWDSIPEAEIPVPEFHQRIIDERLAEIDANPGEGWSLEELKANSIVADG
jgi:putative addiction module component (TIGR02574 family)